MKKLQKNHHLTIRITESQLEMINNFITEQKEKNLSEIVRKSIHNLIKENNSKTNIN